MKKFLPLNTDEKCQKEEKDAGQEISKLNCFWDFLTFNTWRQWLNFLERLTSVLSEMFSCTFSDISLSTKYIQNKYTKISTLYPQKEKSDVYSVTFIFAKKRKLWFYLTWTCQKQGKNLNCFTFLRWQILLGSYYTYWSYHTYCSDFW